MIRYYDKHNTEITRDRWLELSATIHVNKLTGAKTPYSDVRRDPIAGLLSDTIVTSWCGLVSSFERKPGVFLVSWQRKGKTMKSEWHETAEEADCSHERMLREARSAI